MRRKVCVALALCFLLGLLAGCGARRQGLPEEPIVFQRGEYDTEGLDSPYVTVEHNGKVFLPYGSIRPKGLLRDMSYAFGDCLGYVEGDKNDRLYALKGSSTEEWLIAFYENGEMEMPLVYRELGVPKEETPECVESLDWEWE